MVPLQKHVAEFSKSVKRTIVLRYSFHHDGYCAKKAIAALLLPLVLTLSGCVPENNALHPVETAPAPTTTLGTPPAQTTSSAVRAEQIRSECVAGRRLICGKVLQINHEGLVVESGYTSLLRPPLTESWVVPGTVPAGLSPGMLELNDAGTPCIGVVFLTDIPKRPKVEKFDYVILMGYPAGEYDYTPVPDVKKSIRKFSGGLDTAVRLTLQAEQKK